MASQENANQKVWLGIVLVVLGIAFLLRNLSLVPFFIPHYIFSWEMILIVVGGAMIVSGKREGVIILIIGTFFILPDVFPFFHFNLRDWWPLLLILAGVSIFLRKRDQRYKEYGESSSDYLEDMAIFGGSDKRFTSQSFKGGKVTSVFGGSDIDFSEARLGVKEVNLNVFCLFGGNNFKIPNDWTVINDSLVIFGGYSDKRQRNMEGRDTDKVLKITGTIIFGGTDIKGV